MKRKRHSILSRADLENGVVGVLDACLDMENRVSPSSFTSTSSISLSSPSASPSISTITERGVVCGQNSDYDRMLNTTTSVASPPGGNPDWKSAYENATRNVSVFYTEQLTELRAQLADTAAVIRQNDVELEEEQMQHVLTERRYRARITELEKQLTSEQQEHSAMLLKTSLSFAELATSQLKTDLDQSRQTVSDLENELKLKEDLYQGHAQQLNQLHDATKRELTRVEVQLTRYRNKLIDVGTKHYQTMQQLQQTTTQLQQTKERLQQTTSQLEQIQRQRQRSLDEGKLLKADPTVLHGLASTELAELRKTLAASLERANSEIADRLTRAVTCCVCLERETNRVLPCGHRFCLTCLSNPGVGRICPTCRVRFDSASVCY